MLDVIIFSSRDASFFKLSVDIRRLSKFGLLLYLIDNGLEDMLIAVLLSDGEEFSSREFNYDLFTLIVLESIEFTFFNEFYDPYLDFRSKSVEECFAKSC